MPVCARPRRKTALMATRQTLWPQLPSAVTVGTINWVESSSAIFGGFLEHRPSVGEYLEWSVQLPAGVQTFSLLAIKGSTSGIWSLKIDGVEVSQFDLYNASINYNNIFSASFSVSVGTHTVRLESVAKHASSTNFFGSLQQAEIVSASPYYATTDALLPGVVDVPPMLRDSASTSTVSYSISTSKMWGTSTRLCNVTDTHVEKIWLPAGTHKLVIIHPAAGAYGSAAITLDGASIGTLNCNGSTAENVYTTITGITVDYTGMHTIVFTGTTVWANWIQFQRTAAAGKDVTRGKETIELYPWMADDYTGNTRLPTSALVFYGGMHAGFFIDNFREWAESLSAGSWSLQILHRTAKNYGKMHILIDSNDSAQIDFYSPGTVDNVRSSAAISVPSTKRQQLNLVVLDKNESATSYGLVMMIVRLTRTGD